MDRGKGFDDPPPVGRQLQADDAMVDVPLRPFDQAQLGSPIGELSGRVVLDQQLLGNLADRRTADVGPTTYDEQELVLGVGQAVLARGLGAPVVEAT